MAKFNLEVEKIKKNILGVMDDTFAVSTDSEINTELRMLRNNIDRIPVQNSNELMLLLGDIQDKVQSLKDKVKYGSEGLYSMIDSINYDVENKALKYNFKQSKLFKKSKKKATKALIREGKKNKEAQLSNLEGFMKDLDRVYDDIAREKYILARLKSRKVLDEATVMIHLDKYDTLQSEKETILKVILAESTGESLARKKGWIKGYITARTFTTEDLAAMATEISELEEVLNDSTDVVNEARAAMGSTPLNHTFATRTENASSNNQNTLRERLGSIFGEVSSSTAKGTTKSNSDKAKQLEEQISLLEETIDNAEDYIKDQKKALDKNNQVMEEYVSQTAELLDERNVTPEGERKRVDTDLNSMRFKINDQNAVLDLIGSSISQAEAKVSVLKKDLALAKKALADLETGLDIDVSKEAFNIKTQIEELNSSIDQTRDALDVAESTKLKRIDASLSGEVEGYKSTDNFEDLVKIVKSSRQ